MPENMQPASKEQAPDPSFNYERSHPEREPGMGDLDAHMNTPDDNPDRQESAVTNRQEPRQVNAEDNIDARPEAESGPPDQRNSPRQPDHSMHDEEPLGSDQAPQSIEDPQSKRHSRTGGKGGTPDAGEPRRNG